MTAVVAFAPIIGRTPRILVLGSLPGVASLNAHEYYAHPRNAFWSIIAGLTGVGNESSYTMRCRAAKQHGIAIWDVLSAATRPGSLDAAIVAKSARINDFSAFLARRTTIELIAFNGTAAAELFTLRVVPLLTSRAKGIQRIGLPSTSPANAGLSLEQKRRAWHAALRPYLTNVAPSCDVSLMRAEFPS